MFSDTFLAAAEKFGGEGGMKAYMGPQYINFPFIHSLLFPNPRFVGPCPQTPSIRKHLSGTLGLYTVWRVLSSWAEFIEEFSGVKMDPFSSLKRHVGELSVTASVSELSSLYSIVIVIAGRSAQF